MKPVAVLIIDKDGVRIEPMKGSLAQMAEKMSETLPKMVEKVSEVLPKVSRGKGAAPGSAEG